MSIETEKRIHKPPILVHIEIYTRTTHVHDALRHAVPVRIAHADRPCGAEMSEINSQSSIKIDYG